MNKEKTTVIFRKWDDGQILALFPYDVNPNNYMVNSYMNLGQHSEADYFGCIESTKPAKHSEYYPLKLELESIGYDLEVREKRNQDKFLKAIEKTTENSNHSNK